MPVKLELWHLILLLLAFFGCVAAFGKLLLNQFEKRIDERFKVVTSAMDKVSGLERELLELRAELPLQYVRREDYIRNQTVIEAKQDTTNARLENIQLQLQQRGNHAS